MSIGVRTIYANSAAQAVTASTVLVDVTGLSTPLKANQRCHFRFFAPCAVAGAASGIKVQVVSTVAPSRYVQETKIFNGSTSAVALATVITAQAATSNALANIANHLIDIEGEIVAGATDGVLKLQFAQLVSDAAAASILAGASLEVTLF